MDDRRVDETPVSTVYSIVAPYNMGWGILVMRESFSLFVLFKKASSHCWIPV